MKRILAILTACILMTGLAGCVASTDTEGAGGDRTAQTTGESGGSNSNSNNSSSNSNSGEKINIVFWHSMGGNHNETINMLAEQFNASQDKITIEPQYQGSYEESINKLKTAMRTKAGPDIVQIYEGGTRFMADSGFITPMQDIICRLQNAATIDFTAF